jgi:hypothetical protein
MFFVSMQLIIVDFVIVQYLHGFCSELLNLHSLERQLLVLLVNKILVDVVFVGHLVFFLRRLGLKVSSLAHHVIVLVFMKSKTINILYLVRGKMVLVSGIERQL